MGEDCLNLNVFTPALGSGNRPVMVWLHGGGFSGGSGNWLLYDGTNLARKEDVVVVSVTHRLNLFGFLHLADLGGGEKWAQRQQRRHAGHRRRAGVGQGEHRGVRRQSGQRDGVRPVGRRQQGDDADGDAVGEGTVPSRDRDERRTAARRHARERHARRGAVPRQARVSKPNQLDRLQQLPWQQLQEAFFSEPRIQGLADGPVVDGRSLPRDQWYPDAPARSADVPLMMGSTETEDAWSDPPPPLEMSEDEMLTRVHRIARNDDGEGARAGGALSQDASGHQQHRRVADHERRQHAPRQRAAARRAEVRAGQGARRTCTTSRGAHRCTRDR